MRAVVRRFSYDERTGGVLHKTFVLGGSQIIIVAKRFLPDPDGAH